jgi:hypothetical protein
VYLKSHIRHFAKSENDTRVAHTILVGNFWKKWVRYRWVRMVKPMFGGSADSDTRSYVTCEDALIDRCSVMTFASLHQYWCKLVKELDLCYSGMTPPFAPGGVNVLDGAKVSI